MRLPSLATALALLLLDLPANASAGSHFFHSGRSFARDVHIALRALASRPPQKRAVEFKRCVAEPQSVFQVVNGSSPTTSRPATAKGGSSTKPPAPTSTPATSPWKVAQNYSGSTFFDGWTFFTSPDPTHGSVNYIDMPTAQSNNLISINTQGHAIMAVETTPTVANSRMSIRIQTQYTFTGGLVILDAVHMPQGCALWPAFWSDGPNWPNNGEIDIVEGVNNALHNQASIHTAPGCTISQDTFGASGTIVGGSDCAALHSNDGGCGIQSTAANNYGAGFNANGGGVYAMQWDNTAIQVWFFPRNSIPADITAGKPLPNTWGIPPARWPATTCPISSLFNSHNAIFDTTICGDWAGNAWTNPAFGQSQSCAQSTGYSTCEAYVQNQGAAFAQAYWEVKSVMIYQTS